ncbi:coatomer subunit gamma [Entomortierella chlamydospora]|uniref:Coatomer subunit gamma n=1 Tax=Entomortierella chlamydospora TaxID=101097 RepID=A0A9P6N359_9FUNG|nr:coatomer subunit gamma [Entomortierella chlamydospora]KAG0021908.1 coatomer subunit gamma [Entomortierella chlamydospora]
MSFSKRDEDSGRIGYHHYFDKTTVLQEARVFNESPINARKCRALLTKILYLISLGETFGTTEATELFFSVTKLFQSKDSALRQMVYLVIKELSTVAEDVIMVTSSLMKDMQPTSEVMYRANAIRVLRKITDASMLQGLERFLKAAIVDKNAKVSSAALVSSYHLYAIAREVVKRWANEAQEAINAKPQSVVSAASSYVTSFGNAPQAYTAVSNSNIVQYHALGLLYAIRQKDRMAVSKLVQNYAAKSGLSGSVLRSPFAQCLLVRYACKVMEEDPSSTRAVYELLEGWLRHKSEMVNLEAAKAICEMKDATVKELFPAVTTLQNFLSSGKPSIKFAAIRALNKLAMSQPAAVAPCNIDMENMITDQNRSISTFAITTLLKTGNEASVERLMKQISGFMSEITDESKVLVVEAVGSLCIKFPAKHHVMLSFLSGALRDDGGYDFKRAVVEAIFNFVKYIPESKEAALSHLCEIIEDCEYSKLSVKILHLLGVEGPKCPQPTKYIRYIYNRVILENAVVRGAAVSALAKFGVNVEDEAVKQSVKVLLSRCLDDADDEVRDRATMYLNVIKSGDEKGYVKDDSTYALAYLERQLLNYVSNPELADTPFDLSTVPKISRQEEQESRGPLEQAGAIQSLGGRISPPHSGTASNGAGARPAASTTPSLDQQAVYAQKLAEVPEFASFGPLFKSTAKPVELTESETEYVVSCVKHVFAQHIVFQFNIKNTLNDSVLEDVNVLMTPDNDEVSLVEKVLIPAPQLVYDVPGIAYVAFERTVLEDYPECTFTNELKFIVKDCDPQTGEPDEEGFEDDYQVEEVSLAIADFVLPSYIPSFNKAWEDLGIDYEVVETLALTTSPGLQEACRDLIALLGMQALENSGTVQGSNVHTMILSGIFIGGAQVLARCRMTYDSATGVTLQLAIRSTNGEVSQILIGAIA